MKSFYYQGRKYTPVAIPPCDNYFDILESKILPGTDHLLDAINSKFNYDKFYRQANKNGYGDYSVFQVEGKHVIPTGIAMKYYQTTPQKSTNLFATVIEEGDRSVGDRTYLYQVECPFSDSADEELKQNFREDLTKLYQQYTEYKVQVIIGNETWD